MPSGTVAEGKSVDISEETKAYLRATALSLKGHDRRLFLARTVRWLGPGGQRQAERELGWNRVTIGKGLHELASGLRCVDAFSARGRRRAEEHLPHLLDDIRAVVDGQCQTDPTFHSQRVYSRLTAEQVRQQLVLRKGYQEAELPCAETIRRKLHQLDFHLRKVAKCRPKKRSRRPTPSSRG